MAIKFASIVNDDGAIQVARAIHDEIRSLQGKTVTVTINEIELGTNTFLELDSKKSSSH